MLPAPATPEKTLALHPSTAPKLAIIVPYFKKAFFGELLSNLARQTDKRFNLYVANDNSPEDPRDLIDEFSSDIAVRYHRFPNRLGDRDLAGQWNRCLKLIRGEDWIWVLPDDDLPSENCVAEFYRAVEQSPGISINVFHLSLAILDSRGHYHEFQADVPERESNLSFYERHLRGAGGGSTLGNAIYRASKLLVDGGFVSFPKG